MKKKLNKYTRREFAKLSAAGFILTTVDFSNFSLLKDKKDILMGGPVFGKHDSPEEWIKAHKVLNYSAAYCPLKGNEDEKTIRSYEEGAKKAGIIIAEVGAWSNPISPDETERIKAIEKCISKLALADHIGANCCVNISGSRGENWAGHHPDNFSLETFDMIVETTRKIIDTVKPNRTFFTLEMMPWAFPDSPDTYLDLIKAIDRKQFGVHVDPVNIINSPRRYYNNGNLIKECFDKLGPHIKSCHAKDIALSQNLTTHLDEVIAGQGNLKYDVYLSELKKLDHVPLMLEHLKTPDEYLQAANHIRKVAKNMNLSI